MQQTGRNMIAPDTNAINKMDYKFDYNIAISIHVYLQTFC